MRKPDTASTSSRALTTACSRGHRTRLKKKASHNVNIFHAICMSRTSTGICGWEEVRWEQLPTAVVGGGESLRAEVFSFLTLFLSLCWPRVSTPNFVKPRRALRVEVGVGQYTGAVTVLIGVLTWVSLTLIVRAVLRPNVTSRFVYGASTDN